ncbi:hypothetical protein M8J77_007276 [Diaphorina citri]|nr:hypothetical protein M8J77_007276 [Diaphorina citri]
MARKSSNHNSGSHRNTDNQDQQQHMLEPSASNENFQHIKIPIIEAEVANNPQDGGDFPKVYEETNDDPPPAESEEFRAPSGEYEAPEYTPPNSGEVFDEDTFQDIVKSVKIPNIKFSGTEKDSDTPIDPDLKIQDDTPEIPAELVDIKIPTSIPKPNVKIKKKSKKKKKKKSSYEEPEEIEIKKPKKSQSKHKRPKSKNPDQDKEYSQLIDNSNPKEEVIIIKPVKKKKPKSVFFSNEFKPDFHFPTVPAQPRPQSPQTRVPVAFYPSAAVKRKPKRINVIIQNKKKRPLLITHQNGDVIYWYPSKRTIPKNAKYVCKRTRFSNQCLNIAIKRPVVVNQPRVPKMSSYTFLKAAKPTKHYFDNSDKDSLYYYKVIKSPKKKPIPGGIIKFSQSLFNDNNEETGSFFKEIDDQGDEGIDEPEAENHEDERITDEEVDNDKETTDDNEDDKDQGGGEEEEGNEEEQQQENPNVYDEPGAKDYQ